MALIQVFVDGVDRSINVQRGQGAVSYDRDTQGQGNGSFMLADVPSGFVPDDGMEVLFKENGTDVFGGIIQTRPRRFAGADSTQALTFYSIEVASWEQRFNKRRVWRAYVDEAFEDIVSDILTDAAFMGGEGITGSILAGVKHTVTFNGETAAECLDILCSLETDGRIWYVTPAKVLTIDVPTATPAPVTLDATNLELNQPKPDVQPDRVGYANMITVVGGNPELPILYTDDDAAEIAARQAIEGGTGIYHDTVEDNELVSAGQVQQRAEGILLQRKKIRERFTGMTNVSGFELGQEVTVNLPNLGISSKAFFIQRITSSISPGANEWWHTIEAIDEPMDGSWQSEYRRKISPKTIPMQIEPTPGLVRVEPVPGVLIHDPPPAPADAFQGAPSGTMPVTPSLCAISHEQPGGGGFLYTLRRGGLANTGGCGGGQFPGCPTNCFANRQSVLEGYAIDVDEKVAQTATFCASWDELVASSFKTSMVVSPDGTMLAFIERGSGGADPVFGVVSLTGGGLLGSVTATGMQDNNSAFEGAWVGDYVYIPGHESGGSLFVFDVSAPGTPALEAEINTSATGFLWSCVPSSDGTALYLVENGGGQLFIALDITDPTAITEADTQVVTGGYYSLDLDEDGTFADPGLIAFRRADASNVRYARLPLTDPHTFGTLDEQITPLSLGADTMEGWTCLYHVDTAMVWRAQDPDTISLANSQVAHVFNVDPVNGVTFVETLTYVHPVGGNLPQARSYIGHRVGSWFGSTANSQVTWLEASFDEVVPYEIEKPLRTAFGGTGIDGKEYAKGDLLAGLAQFQLGIRTIGVEGAKLTARTAEDTGMAWEAGLGWVQVAIDDTDSPYTVPDDVTVILADASAGPITVNLPAVADSFERVLIVKNDGDGTNLVTIDPNGVETIDGDLTRVLDQDEVLGITGSVNEWEVILGAAGGSGTSVLRGYIDGFTTEWISTSSVKFYAGVAADSLSGNDELVTWPGSSSMTKLISAIWAQGDNAGGLATGAVAASTEYNLILITQDSDGAVDFTFDTDPKGANTPGGWTARRRLGSVFTDGSSFVREYTQRLDQFDYKVAVLDVNQAVGVILNFQAATLTCPANVVAKIGTQFVADLAYALAGIVSEAQGSPDTGTDCALTIGPPVLFKISCGCELEIGTDENSQIRYTMNAVGSGSEAWDLVLIWTKGWRDDRGRNEILEEEEETMIRIDYEELLENGSGVTKGSVHASMNLDACGFRWGSSVDRAYLSVKIPEAWIGQELHMVGVFSIPIAVSASNEMVKLEIGFDSYDNDEAVPDVGTVNDGTATNEVDIDHAWPLGQYDTQALELAVWTPSSTERHFIARITRDGAEETSDGNRLIANLNCMEVYIVPVANDTGGYIVGDTVV